MPGDRGAAEPARYALLGLLLSGPSHGYDLARQFTAHSALSDIIHLSPSHLYALLTKLERDTLIVGTAQEAGNRPVRRVYRLTDSGRASLLEWIDQPVGHPRDMRIEFPLKLYLLRSLEPQRGGELIDRQRQAFRNYIDALEQQVVAAGSEADAEFIRAMRAGRIGRAQAALDWLEQWAVPLLAGGGHSGDGMRIKPMD